MINILRCAFCKRRATHTAEETGKGLCDLCAAAYLEGQAHPEATIEPLRMFEVKEYATGLRELTYRVRATSPDQARNTVAEGLVVPWTNERAANAIGFEHVEFASVKSIDEDQ